MVKNGQNRCFSVIFSVFPGFVENGTFLWVCKALFAGNSRKTTVFIGLKTPLFDPFLDTVKTVNFVKKAYLIPITFAKMSVFDVFDENGCFWSLFGHPLVYGCFDGFSLF